MNDSEQPGFTGEFPEPRSALDWARRAGAVPDVMAELRRLEHRRLRRRRAVLSLAAAACAVAAVFVLRPGSTAPVAASPAPATGVIVSAPQQRTLADGSIVELKDGAQIEVAFTSGVRRVTLRRGTAHFQVAKNPSRPFVVTAHGLTVRAVGTAFCVDLAQGSVEVLVTEGRVAVAEADRLPPPSVDLAPIAPDAAMVSAGQHVLVDVQAAAAGTAFNVEPIAPAELADKLGWRLPILRFSQAPLAQVTDAFNRYNTRPMVLADPELADLKISGVLRADKIAALMEILRVSFHLRVEDAGAGPIRINRPADGDS